jgi:sarcosine oxidase
VVIRAGGRTWRARHAVVAVGSWHATGLLPGLGVPITVTRQVMGWFPADRGLYAASGFPVFVRNLGRQAFPFAYGFPIVEAGTVKVGLAAEGPGVDPDAVEREVSPADLVALEDYVGSHLVGVEVRPVRTRVCLQDNSPDRHFVIGQRPGTPQVTVLAGFSGHGFKFAPVIGEIASDLALEGGTEHPIDHLRLERYLEAAT